MARRTVYADTALGVYSSSNVHCIADVDHQPDRDGDMQRAKSP